MSARKVLPPHTLADGLDKPTANAEVERIAREKSSPTPVHRRVLLPPLED